MKKCNSTIPNYRSEMPPATLLWMLRAFFNMGGYEQFVKRCGDVTQLVVFLDESQLPLELDRQSCRQKLKELQDYLEADPERTRLPKMMTNNVRSIAEIIGLNAIECRLLEFAVVLHDNPLFELTLDCLGELSTRSMVKAIATLIDLPFHGVGDALNDTGILSRSGLIKVKRDEFRTCRHKLNVMSNGFFDRLMSEECEPIDLIRGTVNLVGRSNLSPHDYRHLAETFELLEYYLRNALEQGRKGVNIFVYGQPGTGKTELSRLLAQSMDAPIYEIAFEDGFNSANTGHGRLAAYRLAQVLFNGQRSLIVFDECQDVFDNGNTGYGSKSTAQLQKARINRLLEENPVPTIWLSNSVSCVDPAMVRRFDMVFELKTPPKSQRIEFIKSMSNEFLDDAAVARIAASDQLVPAVIERAHAVVSSVAGQLTGVAAGDAVELLISNTLQAQGYRHLSKRIEANRLPSFYDPSLVHADTDLDALAKGLAMGQSARICLYGPPGTGKSAFGHWVAEQLDKRLLIKRSSDLLDPFVGSTERKISQAFEEAQSEGAILLIDEVDSFLQDRRNAVRSWEVTQVNEMLTQMESFQGVFIASTNLMTGLDQASLRRFDMKINFDYLRFEQARDLLCRHVDSLGLAAPTPRDIAQLRTLQQVTPGDFAAIHRQHRFRPLQTCAEFVDALSRECALKEAAKRPIGFIH